MLVPGRYSEPFKFSLGLFFGLLLLFVGIYSQRLAGAPRFVELAAGLSALIVIAGSFVYFGSFRSREMIVRKYERPLLCVVAVVMLALGVYGLTHLTPIPGAGH